MLTRRKFFRRGLGMLLLPALPVVAQSLLTTPRQPTGPFYPHKLPLDDDNDLTQVEGAAEVARGQITDLEGRLLDRNGGVLAGTRIEIWQCDANGRYHHPWDAAELPTDPGFQGHGHTYSDHQGRYRFRTIRPVHYPGRAPHIHVAVFPEAERPFVTQLYVAGEARNSEDMLYRRVPGEQRHLVTATFEPTNGSRAELHAEWDLVLGVNAAPERRA
ncbi:MAG: intradiol ring-cleavage dioxygenase [Gammaproteobacteria bacterium]|nr:intradiol ring-cleavage dioxygenase [Gammaproteobacteria bacterium]